ncbi:hypothetical protein EJF36_19880 [Bacillus sp. HMF5848]|uniref:hypothetical protein n=1 Tax=Bacillus sp. HMF5848 TaxID=2495421 RepID=UPI000F766AE7|nr:hypothetical protein [Bacillus sp. HMF5848]RSK28957.1 hypothetical protein EJF36_19880 [Bacillus sp. HMF5848]
MITVMQEADIPVVQAFLQNAGVNTDGIENMANQLLIVRDAEEGIIATLGLERIGNDGVLRSLVINPQATSVPLVPLFETMIQVAKEQHIHMLYLVTNKRKTIPLFELMDFSIAKDIPDTVYDNDHIQTAMKVDGSVLLTSSLI